MMVRTVLIWSLLQDKYHRLREDEKGVVGVQPIIDRLFPGLDYYSISGFIAVSNGCVKPALKKLFPELLTTPEDEIAEDAMTEVPEFLPSNGYQWREDVSWRTKFEKLVQAA